MKYKQITASTLTIALIVAFGQFWQTPVKAFEQKRVEPSTSVAPEQPSLLVTDQPVNMPAVALVSPGCQLGLTATDDLLFGASVDLWRLGNCASVSLARTRPNKTIVAVGQAQTSVQLEVASGADFEKPIALQTSGNGLPSAIPAQAASALIAAIALGFIKSRPKSIFANVTPYVRALTQSQLMVFRC